MIAYIREFTQTENNRVNFEKLTLELRSSKVPFTSIEPLAGKIYINCVAPITTEEETELDLFISNHDGAEPDAFDEEKIKIRENKIRGINQLAIYSPYLPDNVMTVSYLTSIDNYINAYIRSGITDVIVQKISEDAANPEGEFFAYLHTVVNQAGNKTYEYLIGTILS